MAKVVPVAEDTLARERRGLEARCVEAEVTGDAPIRDALTRESVHMGGVVRLDPQATMIQHLVHSGAIRLAAPKAAVTPEA